MPSNKRIALLTDPGSFKEIDANLESIDTLKFEGVASYTEKLISNKKKTGLVDAVVSGHAQLNGMDYALAVMDFLFHEVGYERIESRHDPKNPNSGKVMMKCGMQYEGTHRMADWNNQGICDAAYYARLRTDQ